MKTLSIFVLAFLADGILSAPSIDQQQQKPLSPIPLTTPSSSTSLSSLLELHQTLVEYSSISGNENDVAKYLSTYLHDLNLTVELQEVTPATKTQPARSNILAYIGTTRKTKTLLSSHIDTVPPFWPYERRGDEIWGRGTVDAKGSVAAQVQAFFDLLAAKEISEGDVALLFVVGEEEGGDGMKAANKLDLSWDAVIFGEPTGLKLASGHKGMLGFRISAKGKAGHSGYPELGRSANAMLIPALYEIGKLELEGSEKLGNTTLNIGKMDGGVAGNVIPEDAYAAIAIRIAGGTIEGLKKQIGDVVAATPWGKELDFDWFDGYEPVAIDHDVEGFETVVVNYGTDIPNLNGTHKRYLYGPGTILVAHSDHEHLKISDLETAVEGYKTLVRKSLE